MVFRRFYKNKEFSVVFPPRWAHPLFSEQSASMKYELTPCTWMQSVTNKASWSNRKIFSSVFQLIPGKVSNPMGADLRKVIISAQQPSCLFQTSTTCMSPASNHPTIQVTIFQSSHQSLSSASSQLNSHSLQQDSPSPRLGEPFRWYFHRKSHSSHL